jgi:hypothetical protein
MFRLAATLGMTVRELGARMDAAELAEWLAYEGEYGLPDGYFVAGVLGPVVANTASEKNRKTAADFVPYFRRHRGPARRMTGDEMRARFMAATAGRRQQRV